MDRMTIKGLQLDDGKERTYGTITRSGTKDTISLDPPDQAELLEVRYTTLAVGGGGLAPDHPLWFDGLPIEFDGAALWAEPDDFEVWARRAKDLFGFDYLRFRDKPRA